MFHGHGPCGPPYKYPHTHMHCNDPLEAIKYLNTAVVRIEQFLKWLTETHNDDVSRILTDFQTLLTKILEYIPRLVASLEAEAAADIAYKERVESSIVGIMQIIEEITNTRDGLIKCIEDTLKKHKDRLDGHDTILADHERRITIIERLLDGLEIDVDFNNGFSKKLLDNVSALDANSSSIYYDPSSNMSIESLCTFFADTASTMSSDIVLVYPNGFFATTDRIDSFAATEAPDAKLRKDDFTTVVSNDYAIPLLGEINTVNGTFSIQAQCSNETSVASTPSYAFGTYYSEYMLDNGVPAGPMFFKLAHGDTTMKRAVWMMMFIKPDSDYGKILNESDAVLNVSSGGITIWNFGLSEGRGVANNSLSLFADRNKCPISWPVNHRVSKVDTPRGAVLVFQANSVSDGFNTDIGQPAVFYGKQPCQIGCADTFAFNLEINVHSANAAGGD